MARRGSTNRRITYRRAAWLGRLPDGIAALQQTIEVLCQQRITAAERLANHDAGASIVLSRWEPTPADFPFQGVQAEILAFTQGRAAEVAETGLLDTEQVNVEAQFPERGKDFVDGRAFIVVVGDHVVLATSAHLRDHTIRQYLESALKPLTGDAVGLMLSRVARADKMEAIARHGVKRIFFDAAMYNEAAELIARRADAGLMSRLLRFVRDQVAQELSEREVAELADLQVAVGLKLPGKTSAIERRALGELAQHIVAEGGMPYILELGNGDKITPQEVVHSKNVYIPLVNGLADHNKLWERMREYFIELSDARALDN